MAEIIEEDLMTFEQYQTELQRKKLQKALKLAVFGDGNMKDAKSWQWPSMSSIASNGAYAASPLQTSPRINNEIVSSSNNLRNMYLKVERNQKKIVASSVKGIGSERENQVDQLMMPPPKFHPRSSRNSRKLLNGSSQNNLSEQDKHETSDNACESSERKRNCKHSNYVENCSETFTSSRGTPTPNFQRNRRAQTFERWTVALNERGEPIVKGILDGGRLEVSKPIWKRLTSTELESVSKDLYRLKGNLVDNEHELPCYVHGKFYSGFPDDWMNVYEIWKRYVQDGSRVTFRWPTRVTDSDDDLISVVTDITFASVRSFDEEERDSESSGELNEVPLNSEPVYEPTGAKNKRDAGSQYRLKSDASTQTSISGVTGHSMHDMRFTVNDFVHDDKENMNANVSPLSAALNKFVNTVGVITSNLTENSQSVECINKLTTMLELFSSVVLNGSVKDGDASKGDSKWMGEPNSLNVTYNFTPPPNTMKNKEAASCNNTSQRKRTFSKAIGKDNDSDNEVYSGVAKIRLNQVIRQKETVLKPSKRKLRSREVSCMEPKVASNQVRKSSAGRAAGNSGSSTDDCSRIIVREESDRLKVKNCTSSNTRTVGKRQPGKESLNEFTKDRNVCETKDDSVHENSFEPSPKLNQVERPMYSSTVKKASNKIVETNDSGIKNRIVRKDDRENGSILEKSGKSINSPGLQDILKKMTPKPVIISCVRTDDNVRMNYLPSNAEKNLFKDNETKTAIDKSASARSGRKNLIRRESSVKSDNSKKSTNPPFDDSNIDNDSDDKCYTECVEVHETANVDHISDQSLQENDMKASECNPKLLSAWTPRVIGSGKDLHLIFQGKLMNEAGHVINRKFQTDRILRRVSARVVETVNHEFYRLLDSPSTKQDVPNKLLHRCRHGCPANIERFCEEWISLQNGPAASKDRSSITLRNRLRSSNSTVQKNVTSRGRRIAPPKQFWAGDRTSAYDGSSNDVQNSVRNNSSRKQKEDDKDETQYTPGACLPEKSRKNSAKQKRESERTRGDESNADESNEISTKQGVENFSDSCEYVSGKKMRGKAEKNVKVAYATIIDLSKRTDGNHSSISVGKHKDLLYSYKRVPLISGDDDISCDDQRSHV